MVFVTAEDIAGLARNKKTILNAHGRIEKFAEKLRGQMTKETFKAVAENPHYAGTMTVRTDEHCRQGFNNVDVDVTVLPKNCEGPWFSFSLASEEVYAASGAHPSAQIEKEPRWSEAGTIADFDRILEQFCTVVRTWRVEDEFGQQTA
jgi:hypothetical protein